MAAIDELLSAASALASRSNRASRSEFVLLSGPRDRIKERLQDWKQSPVTSLLVNGDAALLRELAEMVL